MRGADVIGFIDIDTWAREIAEAEADSVRASVHDALTMGHGASSALPDVSRRLDRLTPEQRRMVIDEIRSVHL
jgi:hypothetical protein